MGCGAVLLISACYSRAGGCLTYCLPAAKWKSPNLCNPFKRWQMKRRHIVANLCSWGREARAAGGEQELQGSAWRGGVSLCIGRRCPGHPIAEAVLTHSPMKQPEGSEHRSTAAVPIPARWGQQWVLWGCSWPSIHCCCNE